MQQKIGGLTPVIGLHMSWTGLNSTLSSLLVEISPLALSSKTIKTLRSDFTDHYGPG